MDLSGNRITTPCSSNPKPDLPDMSDYSFNHLNHGKYGYPVMTCFEYSGDQRFMRPLHTCRTTYFLQYHRPSLYTQFDPTNQLCYIVRSISLCTNYNKNFISILTSKHTSMSATLDKATKHLFSKPLAVTQWHSYVFFGDVGK